MKNSKTVLFIILFGAMFLLVLPLSLGLGKIIRPTDSNTSDTQIRVGEATANFGSNTGFSLGCGAGTNCNRGLLKLDFINDSIEVGATITNFTFVGEVIGVQPGTLVEDLRIFPVNKSWINSTVTHNIFFDISESGILADRVNLSYNLITSNNITGAPATGQHIAYALNISFMQKLFDNNLGIWDKGFLLKDNPETADENWDLGSTDHLTAKWYVIVNYTVSSSTPCTYGGSGNFVINSDTSACQVTSAQNLGGNSMIVIGAKSVDILAKISNFARIVVNAGATLVCRASGGCFG